jgi:hypothetical protein
LAGQNPVRSRRKSFAFFAIATWLFGTYHSSFPIGIYIAVCAVITLVATALRTDYTGKDISADYQSK